MEHSLSKISTLISPKILNRFFFQFTHYIKDLIDFRFKLSVSPCRRKQSRPRVYCSPPAAFCTSGLEIFFSWERIHPCKNKHFPDQKFESEGDFAIFFSLSPNYHLSPRRILSLCLWWRGAWARPLSAMAMRRSTLLHRIMGAKRNH